MKTNDLKFKNLVYLAGIQYDKLVFTRSKSFGIGPQIVQTAVIRYTNANDNRSKKRTTLLLIINVLQGYANDRVTISNGLSASLPVLSEAKTTFLPFALPNNPIQGTVNNVHLAF
jgi:hypothetical protein